jgi:hypothetical protein
MVMMMANTASLNASNRPLPIGLVPPGAPLAAKQR